MAPVSDTPAFPGQLSTEAEAALRETILGHLHAYAHGTGAKAGQNVVDWFAQALADRGEDRTGLE